MRSVWTSIPAIRAEPCVGATKPVSSRIVVVLPAPLGPRKATTCPLGIENDTSRTARNDPNCLHSPSASIMTDVDMPVLASQASDNVGHHVEFIRPITHRA